MRRIVVKDYWRRRVAFAATTTLVAVLSLAGCGSGKTAGEAERASIPASAAASGSQLTAPVSFGTGSADEVLTLEPAGDAPDPVVNESVARKEVDHPQSSPMLLRQVLFTKAKVTASMLGWAGTGSPPVFRGTLAWVGVFEVDPHAPHSCGLASPDPASFPALQDHYYFAVLVDAATGAEATWNEDASGLVLRQCADLWSSRASHS